MAHRGQPKEPRPAKERKQGSKFVVTLGILLIMMMIAIIIIYYYWHPR